MLVGIVETNPQGWIWTMATQVTDTPSMFNSLENF